MRKHMSLRCKLQQGREHKPCSGTCDGHGRGKLCGLPCECECHMAPQMALLLSR